jgi:hypothetical protein
MKKIFLSVVIAFTSFVSNAQVFTLQTFQFQTVTIPDNVTDTVYSDEYEFEATYIFDVANNMISAGINGNFTQLSVFTSQIDNCIYLTYNDFPTQYWVIDISSNTVTFNELTAVDVKIIQFTKSILTKL